MDDRAARVRGQLPDGDQRGDRGRRDRLAALVHHEAAVRVAVEGQPDVGAGCAAPGPAGRAGWPGPAGWPRGWGSCRPARSRAGPRSPAGCRRASTAGTVCPAIPLPASTTTFSGRIPDRSTRPRRCSAYGVSRSRRSTLPRRAGRREVPLGQRTHLAQAGVLPDRRGAGPAQLDPVVLRRVVAGGEHRAGQVEASRRRSRAGRWSRDRRRPRRRPARSRPRRRRPPAGPTTPACRARSPPAGAPVKRDEGGADRPGDLLVELVRDDAAHVVRLDDGRQVTHPANSIHPGTRARAGRAAPLRAGWG